MNRTIRSLILSGVFVFSCAAIIIATSAECLGRVWGIQPATNSIVVVDPVTGSVSSGFTPPGGALTPTQQFGGLTIAEHGGVLLYQNPVANPTSLFRIHPDTGALLSTEFMPAANDIPDFRAGLSYQSGAGTLGQNSVYAINDGAPVQRQDGYGNAVLIDHTPAAATFAGALGGDDTGRLFLASDTTIIEFNPFVANQVIRSYPQPAGVGIAGGLAFDGVSLYLSDLNGRLYTMNPDTGVVIRSVLVQGGSLIGLGAYVPEPGAIALVALGLCLTSCWGGRRRA
jgi:hypothetical protein